MSYTFRKLNRRIHVMLRRSFHCKPRYDPLAARLACVVIGLTVLFLLGHFIFIPNDGKFRSHIFCFNVRTESLADLRLDPPRPDKAMFFVDTSCISHLRNRITLPARQVCAVEAAAKLHPDWDVYVLFGAPGVLKFDGRHRKDVALKVLLRYDNIKLHRLNYNDMLLQTPLEELAKSRIPFDSPNSQFQANDILRLAVLWKFGGVALDLNMLLLKNIDSLDRNFVGIDHDGYATDIMRISVHFKGRRILRSIIKEVATTYMPDVWNSLGSRALTKAIKQKCPSSSPKNSTQQCKLVKIYPRSTFYPSDMVDWLNFFIEDDHSMLRMVNESYAMKNWNIHIASNVTQAMSYGVIAKRACPETYAVTKGILG